METRQISTERAPTSPSNLFRRRLCAGSEREEEKVPRSKDDESEWCAEGKLLHMHFANKGLSRDPLTATQRDLLELADRLQNDAIRQATEDAGVPEDAPYTEGYERTLTLLDEEGNFVFPGTCDFWRHYHAHGLLVIVDAKFGFLEVTSADNNLQLASYARMAYEEEAAQRIYCAIVQPRAPYGQRLTSAVYTSDMMLPVLTVIMGIVHAARMPDAELNPSPDACRNCRAKPVCPAYIETFREVATLQLDGILSAPDEQFELIGDAIKLAAMLAKPWSAEAKRRIEAGALPGWHLKNNGFEYNITDLPEAYGRFAEKYGDKYESPEDCAKAFMKCVDAKWGELDALFGKVEACGKTKARKAAEALFEGLITKEEKAKSPVRDSGKESPKRVRGKLVEIEETPAE